MSSSIKKNYKEKGELTKLYQLKQKSKEKQNATPDLNKTNRSKTHKWKEQLSKTAENVVLRKTG